MQNEYYYLNELELLMDKFIQDNSTEGEFGWVPPFLAKRMAQAAFSVVQNSKEVSDYVEEQVK